MLNLGSEKGAPCTAKDWCLVIAMLSVSEGGIYKRSAPILFLEWRLRGVVESYANAIYVFSRPAENASRSYQLSDPTLSHTTDTKNLYPAVRSVRLGMTNRTKTLASSHFASRVLNVD